MILFMITSGFIYASLRMMEKVQRTTSEKAGSQLTLRSGSQTVAAELREVNNVAGGGSSDLLTMSGSSVTYWAMRSSGMTCQLAGNEVRIRLGPTYSGYRSIVPIRDSLLLFADHDTVSAADDEWVQVAIVGSASTSTCPDGEPAIALTTPGLTVADYQVPGPVRTFELMQLALATTGGRLYLGALAERTQRDGAGDRAAQERGAGAGLSGSGRGGHNDCFGGPDDRPHHALADRPPAHDAGRRGGRAAERFPRAPGPVAQCPLSGGGEGASCDD